MHTFHLILEPKERLQDKKIHTRLSLSSMPPVYNGFIPHHKKFWRNHSLGSGWGGREFGEPLPEYILGEIDILLGESSHFANTLLYAGEQLNNFANDPKFGERVPYYGELENKHDK